MVLETNGASDFSVSVQSNPYRLVVEIRKAAKAENSAVCLYQADRQEASLPNIGLQNKDSAEASDSRTLIL